MNTSAVKLAIGTSVIVTMVSFCCVAQSNAGANVPGAFVDVTADGGVAFSANDGPAYVIRNVTKTTNHWLTLDLVGHKSNRDAVGAVVKLVTSTGAQWWTVSTAGSYLSASDKRAHFGLGADSVAKSIEIAWPSGIHQQLDDVKGDQILRVDEPLSK